MLFDIVLYMVLSIIAILSFHLIYNYLKDNYSTKKVKYLGRFQNEKYKEILNELRNKHEPEIIEEDQDYIPDFEERKLEQSLLNYVQSSI